MYSGWFGWWCELYSRGSGAAPPVARSAGSISNDDPLEDVKDETGGRYEFDLRLRSARCGEEAEDMPFVRLEDSRWPGNKYVCASYNTSVGSFEKGTAIPSVRKRSG
jgi:hypothetical protein